jgi:hypothetical protein
MPGRERDPSEDPAKGVDADVSTSDPAVYAGTTNGLGLRSWGNGDRPVYTTAADPSTGAILVPVGTVWSPLE